MGTRRDFLKGVLAGSAAAQQQGQAVGLRHIIAMDQDPGKAHLNLAMGRLAEWCAGRGRW